MSHFSVMCITHTSDPFELEELLSYYDENLEVELAETDEGDEYYYNPDGKWDWWTVGGRWSNFLHLKDGSLADKAMKGEISFGAKRAQEARKARERWNLWDARLKHLPPAKPYHQVSQECLAEGKTTSEAAREIYWSQPRVKAIQAMKDFSFEINYVLDTYQNKTLEQYVAERSDLAHHTYALLTHDDWYAPGEMGWFGYSDQTDESVQDYDQLAKKVLSELSNEAWITIVDCHC